MASKKSKTGLGLVLAALLGSGVYFWYSRKREEPASVPDVILEVDIEDPTDLPPNTEDPTAPSPSNIPPPAPTWNPDLVFAEQATAQAVVDRYLAGSLKVKSGSQVQWALADVALQETYPNAPSKIPAGWGSSFGWQPWVDASKRLFNYVGDALAARK